MIIFAAFYAKRNKELSTRKKKEASLPQKQDCFSMSMTGYPIEEFCKSEKVSYSKMLNCLGRTNHQYHPASSLNSDMNKAEEQQFAILSSNYRSEQEERRKAQNEASLLEQGRLASTLTIFANCKAYNIDPYKYLCDVFRRIKNTAKDELVNLVAHKWQPQLAPAIY